MNSVDPVIRNLFLFTVFNKIQKNKTCFSIIGILRFICPIYFVLLLVLFLSRFHSFFAAKMLLILFVHFKNKEEVDIKNPVNTIFE